MKNKPFDFTKVQEFDKHIEMSIPNYEGLANTFRGLVNHHSWYEGTIIDLGCSTGKFLHSVDNKPEMTKLGIDIIDMVEYPIEFEKGHVSVLLNKLVNDGSHDVCTVVSMFTMQFLHPHDRKQVLMDMKTVVDRDGCVLVAEKVILDDSALQTEIHRIHVEEKRNNFTDTEILDKDAQLANSMHCVTESQLITELSSIGTPSRVWQSYNFVGYIIK